MAKCQFIKENGQKCEANAILDSDLCFSHNPELEEARMIAVKKGGLNRKLYDSYGEPLILENPSDIKRLLTDTINLVWQGKMPSNSPANTIGFLARCWIDIHGAIELKREWMLWKRS